MNKLWRLWLPALMMISAAACAGGGAAGPAALWQCDAAADEAVDRGAWEEARTAHERLLVRQPTNGLAFYHLGYICGKLDDREAEIDAYHKAVAHGYNRDDQLYFNLGMALSPTNPRAGLKALETAVRLNPQNADNIFGLALMADTLGLQARAIQALHRALALQPQHSAAQLLLARIDLDLSRWQEAHRLIEGVLEREPENEEALELMEILVFRQSIEYNQPSKAK